MLSTNLTFGFQPPTKAKPFPNGGLFFRGGVTCHPNTWRPKSVFSFPPDDVLRRMADHCGEMTFKDERTFVSRAEVFADIAAENAAELELIARGERFCWQFAMEFLQPRDWWGNFELGRGGIHSIDISAMPVRFVRPTAADRALVAAPKVRRNAVSA